MAFALAAVNRRTLPVSQAGLRGQSLREKILCIPCDQRAVFILRSALGMADSSVALATGLPVERMRSVWLSSLLNLRELLPRGFFERRASRHPGDMAGASLSLATP
jgi:DNA-directed RNA polymerase specialized sigma24 family protein